MNLARFRTRRQRLRFAWLALLALLFQQVALAAYACPMAEAPPQPQALMAGCEGMEMPDADAPALCNQHCQRDHLTTSDLRVAQVPPLALPARHFDLVASLLPSAPAQYYEDVPTCRSDPPPAQRFCSLQI
ncbi:hypothetical protein [Xanthomonas hortorum]|uniref:hypothetical protein n=1 Tax=Xanthomonas hortorum TaxID=56454 RepID=UPI0032E88C9E